MGLETGRGQASEGLSMPRRSLSPRRTQPLAGVQPAVTGVGFSIGTPIRLPYSVQLPS
jgi:hypothetical protein